MTGSTIESAKKFLASGVPPVASNFGVSVPTLYCCIPASTQHLTCFIVRF
jgi:hypothetical protein